MKGTAQTREPDGAQPILQPAGARIDDLAAGRKRTRIAARISVGVRARPGVAVAALELAAGAAGTRVVPADARELVAGGGFAAGLHVDAAVDGWRGVLEPARRQPGRHSPLAGRRPRRDGRRARRDGLRSWLADPRPPGRGHPSGPGPLGSLHLPAGACAAVPAGLPGRRGPAPRGTRRARPAARRGSPATGMGTARGARRAPVCRGGAA
jgi:hypothetical protein